MTQVMTAVRKIKWAILARYTEMEGGDSTLPYPYYGIDEKYEEMEEECKLDDAIEEVRGSGIETPIEAPHSRHLESQSVGMKMPDDSWVGWTYWYGGGKWAEPEAVEWINEAYDLTVAEEEKVVTVRTFAKA
jgi:hypothetical protein